MVTVAIASDHAGVELKSVVLKHLSDRSITTHDFGPNSSESVDYPDFAHKVSEAVQTHKADVGILICGTGIGMALSATKHKGIRAASLTEHYQVVMARKHNDLNVLCLGARVVGSGVACELVDTFLQTTFEGGRHAARLAKLSTQEGTLP